MPSRIQFLREPRYTDTVLLFILAPAGVSYRSSEIGRNLFGSESWEEEALIVDGLASRPVFRFSDIGLQWEDFLDLAFRHSDHALFYLPDKQTFAEIRKEILVPQNPDLYSFSFHRFTCEARRGMVLPPPVEEPVVRPIVPPAAAKPTAQVRGRSDLVDGKLVSVDAAKLALLMDRLDAVYSDGLRELRELRSLLSGGSGT